MNAVKLRDQGARSNLALSFRRYISLRNLGRS